MNVEQQWVKCLNYIIRPTITDQLAYLCQLSLQCWFAQCFQQQQYCGGMANQEICINRKKENFRKKKRIIKKSMRNQTNNRTQTDTAPPISDKKARRQAKKEEIKKQKKLNKQLKRQQKMEIQESD